MEKLNNGVLFQCNKHSKPKLTLNRIRMFNILNKKEFISFQIRRISLISSIKNTMLRIKTLNLTVNHFNYYTFKKQTLLFSIAKKPLKFYSWILSHIKSLFNHKIHPLDILIDCFRINIFYFLLSLIMGMLTVIIISFKNIRYI